MTEKKLRPKYVVFRIDDERYDELIQSAMPSVVSPPMLSTNPGDVDSPFVLMPRKDPAAFRAMVCYALYCEPDLRAEIASWLGDIASTEPAFGTQGVRNYQYLLHGIISTGLG